MTDFDPAVRRQLDLLVPVTATTPNWSGVIALTRPPLWRRPLVVALAAALALVVTGAGLTAALGGFDRWLSGKPGSPAAPADQARFRAANGRSWASFPTGTRLRQLIDTTVDGKRFVLFGFRSGNDLCLQLRTVTLGHTLSPICTPATLLAHLEAPITLVDPNDGLQDQHAHPDVQFSYGIVADSVRQVEVLATDGMHRATVGGNAYLWVENDPNTGNQVQRVIATTARGKTSLPVLSWPFGPALLVASPPGPTRVQAVIAHPTIRWYFHNTPRGLSIGQARLSARQRDDMKSLDRGSTRLVKPDPLSNVVLALTGKRCVIVLQESYSELCDRPGQLFPIGPLNLMTSTPRSGSASLIAGVASDGVARIVIFLADGERERVALRDNLFDALVPSSTSARVVAYDSSGRVVFTRVVSSLFQIPAAAFRHFRDAITVRAPNGAVGTIAFARPVGSFHCWRARFSTGQEQTGCPVASTGPWVSADSVQPAGRDVFIFGAIRPPVVRVRLRFADGSTIAAKPVDGLFMFAIPRSHLSRTRQLAFVIGYEAFGDPIQRRGVLFRQSP